ncbi:TRASH domain-containing protein [Dehalogenimonas etheniformans]|uniref:TRASH domain-containing protein n=1 Tax=Dehalogenimonas etheniformans TaxID=1536648 RepID=UPI00167F9291|nr:TRASH domain-containing protein [Dehalogenimonas etheniformans]QNT75259.1 TRASH domain-containing protein [Dehalogenimonas etheniformans]
MDLKKIADKGKEMAAQGKQAAGKVMNKVDVTCDACGKLMKPGGIVKKTIGDKDYQFCSNACVATFKPGQKTK